jgi:hypothetical protein
MNKIKANRKARHHFAVRDLWTAAAGRATRQFDIDTNLEYAQAEHNLGTKLKKEASARERPARD